MEMNLKTMIIIAPLFLKGSGKWGFFILLQKIR